MDEAPAARSAPLASTTTAALEEAARIAGLVESDHEGRAVNVLLHTEDEATTFKELVKEWLRSDPPEHACPWRWRVASTGSPLSAAGAQTGIELRFQYVKKGCSY